ARDLGLDPTLAEDAHDVSMVDVRHKVTKLLAMSFEEFTAQLEDPQWLVDEMYKGLYDGAVGRLGPPSFDEMYTFVPALAMGGAMEPDYLQRVPAAEGLAILFQL